MLKLSPPRVELVPRVCFNRDCRAFIDFVSQVSVEPRGASEISTSVGVTVAAGRLQDVGTISYVRGHIKILDRQRMEETVCECYRVVKDEFDRLLG